MEDFLCDHNHRTVIIHIKEYLRNLVSMKYSPKSIEIYEYCLNRAVYWLKQYLKSVRPKLCKNLDEHSLWISKNTGRKLTYPAID